MKLYTTAPFILTVVTWVQGTQVWHLPSTKSGRRMAFGQTESYSVLPCLLLAALIGPPILTLVTWVQRRQAWPSVNSARRLALGQTESYSAFLPLAAMIGPAGQM